MNEFFSKAAQWTSKQAGHASTFVVAVLVIVVWAATGPIFNYSDSWRLIINSSTTIATFLMVFLIQNTQNRDTIALQAKLNELIRVTKNARDNLISIEDQSEERLREVKEEFACEEDGTRKPGPGEPGVDKSL